MSVSPPPPSETTIKPSAAASSAVEEQNATSASSSNSNSNSSSLGRTASLSAAIANRLGLDEALSSDDKTVQRQAGFRARSINSIRGLAAAWVPARFVPSASQPGSSAVSSAESSSSKDDDDASSASGDVGRRRDGLALTSASTSPASSRSLVKAGEGKRPVKLDRRRLDKAVSLAVEAAQAAEEDERLWEEKRAKKAAAAAAAVAQKESSPRSGVLRPSLKGAWSFASRSRQTSNNDENNLQVAKTSQSSTTTSDDDVGADEDEDEDDLGFSLDLYISSLGYLISAISDKDAPGLSSKQREDIRQRLEEGMSKLGFDAKAELAKAEEMKRQLELEREKLQLQQQQQIVGSPTANVIHHHYHTAVPAAVGMFGGVGDFSRAHAAAKVSAKGSSSLAGKISSSVLDIGLHIGAGALSALSANLSAIAPTPSVEEQWEEGRR